MAKHKIRILRTWMVSTRNPSQRDIRGMFLHTGTIEDLSDVAKIAHAKGKEVFRTSDDIRVLPICQPLQPIEDGYLLIVEKIGLHNQPLVGKKRGEHNAKSEGIRIDGSAYDASGRDAISGARRYGNRIGFGNP